MIINNFIVFEGIDGAGTTTQLKKLKEVFSDDELEITAEPTSLETGKFLRRLLKGEFEADPKTAAFLFAADRCEHIWGKGGVYEKCESGKIVVSDRYIFSSLAYQGVSAGTALPEKLNEDFPLPRLLFYFKINPEVSLKRVLSRGGNLEIYEKLEYQKQTAANFDRVIGEYDGTPKGSGMKVITIDAEKTPEEIHQIILKEIESLKK